MRILFLANANNSLSQRAMVELTELGHQVSLELALGDAPMIEAAELFGPDLVIAPMLTKKIPEAVWRRYVCLIVHPGIVGDRGPSSIDWALLEGEREWGVTIVQAEAEFDAGPVWAAETFAVPADATKSSLYRSEVTEAAIRALLRAVAWFQANPGVTPPKPPPGRGRSRPPCRQPDRAVDWRRMTTGEIVRRIRASDSAPGVSDVIDDREIHLYGAHEEDSHAFRGWPGTLLAQRHGAVLRATVDGAVWVTHAKARSGRYEGIKLPATMALGKRAAALPWSTVAIDTNPRRRTWRDIRYVEDGPVGYLHWDLQGGAMGTDHCQRLRHAFIHARSRPTRVIVLCGGRDFFSNGIHLNLIEAADDPAEESWRNINAIDDLVEAILTTSSHLVVAALQGNAGAGGAMLPLAADIVFARNGVVLNPHYETMELSGSEYWTYTLPRRVGEDVARDLTTRCLPLGARQACRIGFLDDVFGDSPGSFMAEVAARATSLAVDAPYRAWLQAKNARRARDEAQRSLDSYRREELARMRRSFWGERIAYHEARRRFVRKIAPAETPGRFALHRATPLLDRRRVARG